MPDKICVLTHNDVVVSPAYRQPIDAVLAALNNPNEERWIPNGVSSSPPEEHLDTPDEIVAALVADKTVSVMFRPKNRPHDNGLIRTIQMINVE